MFLPQFGLNYPVPAGRVSRLFNDTSNSYLRNNTGAPRSDGPVTISCWAYPHVTPGAIRYIVNWYVDGTYSGVVIGQNSDGTAFFRWHTEGGIWIATSTGTFVNNAWNHILVTADAGGDPGYIYLNNSSGDDNGSFYGIGGGFTGLIVGTSYNAGNIFDGAVGEIGAWDVILSEAERKALYYGANPSTIHPDHLISHIPLDDNKDIDIVQGIGLDPFNSPGVFTPPPVRPRQRKIYYSFPVQEAPAPQTYKSLPNVLLNRGGWVGDKPPTVDFRINKRSPQYKGLKHWLPLVKDEGARARDFTDRLGLTSYVSPLWTPTEKGIAAGFDGNGTTSTSYIRLNESSGDTLLPGTSFPSMVSVWFYANTITDEGSVDHAFIWALAVSGGLSGYPLSLFVSNASGWYPLTVTTRANDTYYSIRPTTGVAWDGNFDDQWHHITWMYNGRGASTLSNYKIIWNGVEQTIEASGTLPLGDSNSYLGLYEQPSDQYLVGQIQDFRVYDNFDTVLAQEIYRNRFELFEPIQPQFYWEIPAEAGTVFPFSDDFTGNTGDPWDITKWTTSVEV